jgi:hypothetical protein
MRTSESSQIKAFFLKQAVSCHVTPSLYQLLLMEMHASTEVRLGLSRYSALSGWGTG